MRCGGVGMIKFTCLLNLTLLCGLLNVLFRYDDTKSRDFYQKQHHISTLLHVLDYYRFFCNSIPRYMLNVCFLKSVEKLKKAVSKFEKRPKQ